MFPETRTLIGIVRRMNRENVRTPARSIANLEFHHTTDEINEIARKVVAPLERSGVRATTGGAAGFPMEADRWGAKMWIISHKPVAVAAGLGHMGIHRNVIHPKFGNFILLGTILMDAEVSEYSRHLDYNPCLECKLCVAACPTGAIGSDGHSIFPPATRTTTGNSWADSTTGWKRLRRAAACASTEKSIRGRDRVHVAKPVVRREL